MASKTKAIDPGLSEQAEILASWFRDVPGVHSVRVDWNPGTPNEADLWITSIEDGRTSIETATVERVGGGRNWKVMYNFSFLRNQAILRCDSALNILPTMDSDYRRSRDLGRKAEAVRALKAELKILPDRLTFDLLTSSVLLEIRIGGVNFLDRARRAVEILRREGLIPDPTRPGRSTRED
jgi:hypothetical protein